MVAIVSILGPFDPYGPNDPRAHRCLGYAILGGRAFARGQLLQGSHVWCSTECECLNMHEGGCHRLIVLSGFLRRNSVCPRICSLLLSNQDPSPESRLGRINNWLAMEASEP